MNNKLGKVAIIGGGPAGLMAADVLIQGGAQVDLYDAMPSVGRKFLMAGKGGMNITHAEPKEAFLSRYGTRRAQIKPLLDAFGSEALREWVHGLGITTFVGTSGRVFPADMKAAPLLRAWLHRLRKAEVHFHMRHRWCGWNEQNDGLCFSTEQGELNRACRCGGAGTGRRQLGTARFRWRMGAAARATRHFRRAIAPRELRFRCRLERVLQQ